MNFHSKFNNKLLDFLSRSNIGVLYFFKNDTEHLFVGSIYSEQFKSFLPHPECFSIQNKSSDFLFSNLDINKSLFEQKTNSGKIFKLGFENSLIQPFINSVLNSDDTEIKDYLIDNAHLIGRKDLFLYNADTPKSLISIMKMKHIDTNDSGNKIYRANVLSLPLFNVVLAKLKSTDIDFTSQLKCFLTPYINNFKKEEYSSTIILLIKDKFPLQVEEFKNFLNINKKPNSLINISTSLVSIQYSKKELYNLAKVNKVINKDQFWNTFKLVETFLNKNKKEIGINYVIINGYKDTDDSFNIIIEKNEKFKISNLMTSTFLLKVYTLFFGHEKSYKLNKLDIDNGLSIFRYVSLNSNMDNNNSNPKIIVKI